MEYGSYVIRIPQQENELFKRKSQNNYLDHWYNETHLIYPWIFKAKFYLTEHDAKIDLDLLKMNHPSLIVDVKEVRLRMIKGVM